MLEMEVEGNLKQTLLKPLFMRQLSLLFMAASLAAVTFLGSCKDDEKSNTELLTDNCWIATSITVDPPYPTGIPGQTVTDWYAQLDQCDKDDIVCFKGDGTYTSEEGATKCDDSDPQVIESGTWTFNQGETVINISESGGDSYEYEVIDLDKNTLKFKQLFDNIGGVNYYITITAEHN